MTTEGRDEKERRRASNVLILFHVIFLIMALLIVGKTIRLQYSWEPDAEYEKFFKPKKDKDEIEAQRGAIIDHNGKLLAISTPMYDIYMDCYVLKELHDTDKEKGKELEDAWMAKAMDLAKALPKVLDDGKNAAYYSDLITTGRRNKKRYVPIAKGIDHGTVLELKTLPLFNEGNNRGGMIVERIDTRQYPYEGLARRVIGYVKHNSDTNVKHIGIEGKYDYVLHGRQGLKWLRQIDGRNMIKDVDSNVVAVENGLDVRTTLDINIQDMADRALRKHMATDDEIVGGCAVVMEVETGAVRAMVNLQKDKKGEMREVFNMAAGSPSEPGSVFKTVTLATLLEDGETELESQVRTCNGLMEDMPEIKQDTYIRDYQKRTGKTSIPVIEGFKISSNYVFRRLAKDSYGDAPERFISRLHEYNFGEAYDFDLKEEGSARPRIPDPKSEEWTMSDLVASAIGYSVRVTPLQMATFYNAIANDGKMMKPYIVESIEQKGNVRQEFKPVILNGSICSKATADTLTRALTMVTLEGTASRLKDAKCTVAGKTGTARMHLTREERRGSGKPYEDIEGRKKHQATFVGYFPAENPKYTTIVVVYTGLISHDVYGGKIPTLIFKDIVDGIWAYDSDWGSRYVADGSVPEMRAAHISTHKGADSPVPDVNGLGLKDALYAIENNGYRCSYTGTGHVRTQTPAAGSALKKGETIKIELR